MEAESEQNAFYIEGQYYQQGSPPALHKPSHKRLQTSVGPWDTMRRNCP